MSSLECIWPAEALLGEAPFWSVSEEILYWVDIDGKTIFRYQPNDGSKESFVVNQEIGCIIPAQNGGFIAGMEKGLALIDPDLSTVNMFAEPEADIPGARFNDGKCDRRGRFWVASADREEQEPIAALYRVCGPEQVEQVINGFVIGNGLGWSPDDRTMYFTDSARGQIRAFDYDIESGQIDSARIFSEVDPETGMPDGLCVDAEGYVWSAHWGGWRVTRYDPEGKIDRVIELPVPNVTSLAFGGTDLDVLFITTARIGMTDQELSEAPLSGGLFALNAGTKGIPDAMYGSSPA